MSRVVLVTVDGMDRARFFYELMKNSERVFEELVFITFNINSHIYLKSLGCECILIKKCKASGDKLFDKEILLSCLEYKSKRFSLTHLERIYYSIRVALTPLLIRYKYVEVLHWNGARFLELFTNHVLDECGVFRKSLYFEIANFPGYIFVDECGTNGSSKFSVDASDQLLNFNDELIEEFNEFKIKKSIEKLPPQAMLEARSFRYYINELFFIISNRSIFSDLKFLLKLLKEKITKKYAVYKNAKIINYISLEDIKKIAEGKKLILFPLQVENDTNVLVHCKYSYADVVKFIRHYCAQNNFILLVKPHPAERVSTYLHGLLQTSKSHDVFFTSLKVEELFPHVTEVWTINSTVGLQALIAGKPLRAFGRTYYGGFGNMLAEDIFSNFFMIDYFRGVFNKNEVERVFKLLD